MISYKKIDCNYFEEYDTIPMQVHVKSHFNKGGGALGNSGSVAFQFNKMGVFKLNPEGLNAEELESLLTKEN